MYRRSYLLWSPVIVNLVITAGYNTQDHTPWTRGPSYPRECRFFCVRAIIRGVVVGLAGLNGPDSPFLCSGGQDSKLACGIRTTVLQLTTSRSKRRTSEKAVEAMEYKQQPAEIVEDSYVICTDTTTFSWVCLSLSIRSVHIGLSPARSACHPIGRIYASLDYTYCTTTGQV